MFEKYQFKLNTKFMNCLKFVLTIITPIKMYIYYIQKLKKWENASRIYIDYQNNI